MAPVCESEFGCVTKRLRRKKCVCTHHTLKPIYLTLMFRLVILRLLPCGIAEPSACMCALPRVRADACRCACKSRTHILAHMTHILAHGLYETTHILAHGLYETVCQYVCAYV